jgi:hypothetical protein
MSVVTETCKALVSVALLLGDERTHRRLPIDERSSSKNTTRRANQVQMESRRRTIAAVVVTECARVVVDEMNKQSERNEGKEQDRAFSGVESAGGWCRAVCQGCTTLGEAKILRVLKATGSRVQRRHLKCPKPFAEPSFRLGTLLNTCTALERALG